jgi:hypothetical protein
MEISLKKLWEYRRLSQTLVWKGCHRVEHTGWSELACP